MVKYSKKYAKAAAAGQMPLLTPDSDWVAPKELPDLRNRPFIAADLETKDDGLSANRGPGWVYGAGYVCGAVLAADGISVYAPIRHPEGGCLDPERVREWWNDHMRCRSRIIFQNAPYDLGWGGTEFDAPTPENIDDTQAMANILDETRLTYNLDDLCRWQGIEGKDERLLAEAAAVYTGASKPNEIKASIHKLPARYAGPYAEQDGTSTLNLAMKLLPLIEAEGSMEAYRLECDIIPLVVWMRRQGIRIDLDEMTRNKAYFFQKRDEALAELSRQMTIGRSVTMKDVMSSTFLERVFEDQGVPVPTIYEDGEKKDSFDADLMSKYDHWLPQLVAKSRQFHMAGDKFIGNYIEGFTHMGRIHSEIHQYRDDRGGTRTTRLAYSNPPLQQMPIRNLEIGPRIRRGFLPERGELWFAPDYSQQEFRLIVHFASICQMAGAQKAVEIYQRDPNTNFHDVVVQLTGLIYQKAKDANFAKAFRAGVPKFSMMIGSSVEEARAIYDQYDDEMPFVSRLAEHCDTKAQERGWIKLIDGARGHFDQWEPRWIDKAKWRKGKDEGRAMSPCSLEMARERAADPSHPWYRARLRRAFTYKAMNKLIQGSAARQTKLAMREFWREKIAPMIQMHDEFGISTSDPNLGKRVTQIMTDVVKLVVPVMVDSEWGVSWGEAAKVKGPDKKIIYGATFEEALAVQRSRAA